MMLLIIIIFNLFLFFCDYSLGKGFLVTPYLRVLEIAMQEDQDNLIDKVRGIYGFRVTHGPNGANGFWIINAKTGKGSYTFLII